MTESGYQGWKNYETWAVNLWLQNDEGTYQYWLGSASDAWEQAEADRTFSRMENAREALYMQLRNELLEAADEAVDSGTLWADLLGAALGDVEWLEIADAFLECVDTDEDE